MALPSAPPSGAGGLASSQQVGELLDGQASVADQAPQRAASQFGVPGYCEQSPTGCVEPHVASPDALNFVAEQAHRPDEVIAGYDRQPHHLDDDFQNLGIFVGNRSAMLYQAFEVQP